MGVPPLVLRSEKDGIRLARHPPPCGASTETQQDRGVLGEDVQRLVCRAGTHVPGPPGPPERRGTVSVQRQVRLLRGVEQLPRRPVHPKAVNLPPESLLPIPQSQGVERVSGGAVDRVEVRTGGQGESHTIRHTRRITIEGVDDGIGGLARHRMAREGGLNAGAGGTSAKERAPSRPRELHVLPEVQHPVARHVGGVEPRGILVCHRHHHAVEDGVIRVLRDVSEGDACHRPGVRGGHPLDGEVTAEIDVDLQPWSKKGVAITEDGVAIVAGDGHPNGTVGRPRLHPEVHRDAVDELVQVDHMPTCGTPGQSSIPIHVDLKIGGPLHHISAVCYPSASIRPILDGH